MTMMIHAKTTISSVAVITSTARLVKITGVVEFPS